MERECDLKQLGGLLDSKGYGIALPKGKDLTFKYVRQKSRAGRYYVSSFKY